VTIATTPPNAIIVLDGVQTPTNPYKTHQKKGSKHTLTVKAPGYLPYTKEAEFDTNLYMPITLETAPEGGLVVTVPSGKFGTTGPTTVPKTPGTQTAPPPPTQTPSAPPPAPSSAPPPPSSPAPLSSQPKPPPRPIDPSNPYAH
jgi:hypothetical protein